MPVIKVLTDGIGEVNLRDIAVYRERGGYEQWRRAVTAMQPVVAAMQAVAAAVQLPSARLRESVAAPLEAPAVAQLLEVRLAQK